MSRSSDVGDEMTNDQFDEAFECFLVGRPVPAEAAPLVAFAETVRNSSARPGRPSPQLAELLATGLLTDPVGPSTGTTPTAPESARAAAPGPSTRRRRTMFTVLAAAAAKFASAGVAAQAATGVGLALVSVTGAGAAGVLPASIQDGVAEVIESVTPFDLPEAADRPVLPEQATVPHPDETRRTPEDLPGPGDVPTKEQFGTSVREDAQDGGVDGAQVSTDARETHQPEQPATPGTRAAERPSEQPATPETRAAERPAQQSAAPPAPETPGAPEPSSGGSARQGSADGQAQGSSGRP
ncbi:hypothetical protein FHU33_3175 [Blastococcus colisei]|uniref:Uncharacterized protein n=1 Tax=Blastococcus colisei TaxID=1564162 RepID=A0A543PI00_9ACTN|nr:hypothetical protein [Blastococcus colisei]TQN43712.1 hypothetical protein FHU33_3175 [Blastococcus colisei]